MSARNVTVNLPFQTIQWLDRERGPISRGEAVREAVALYASTEPLVYFLENPKTKLIKIGFSRSLASRIATLESQEKAKLILRKVVDGGPKEEREYHKRYADNRVRGEWFNAGPVKAGEGIGDAVVDIVGEDDTKNLTVRLTPNEHRAISILAAEMGTKPSLLGAQLIRERISINITVERRTIRFADVSEAPQPEPTSEPDEMDEYLEAMEPKPAGSLSSMLK